MFPSAMAWASHGADILLAAIPDRQTALVHACSACPRMAACAYALFILDQEDALC